MDEDDDSEAQNAQELLDVLRDNYEQNHGRYSEHYVIDFYRKKLNSMPCQNQGYVLEGYPKTYEQAKLLFAGNKCMLSTAILKWSEPDVGVVIKGCA